MPEIKYKLVAFRLEQPHLDSLDQLATKLKVKRSAAVRLAISEAVEKYVSPGFKGEFQVMNTEFLNTILTNLGTRIRELENPKGTLGTTVRESAEAAKRVDELRRQGKSEEAEKIVNERAKKGLYTAPLSSWPESKGELSPEEQEKMLNERYPDRKKQ